MHVRIGDTVMGHICDSRTGNDVVLFNAGLHHLLPAYLIPELRDHLLFEPFCFQEDVHGRLLVSSCGDY
jgi:hypothetical protein